MFHPKENIWMQQYQSRIKSTSVHLFIATFGMKVTIPGPGLWTPCYEGNSLNADYGSYQMHIQQKNLLECLPYYAVLKVLQELIVNACLFDLYDDIYTAMQINSGISWKWSYLIQLALWLRPIFNQKLLSWMW